MTNYSLRVLVVGHTYVVGMNQAKLEALAKTSKVKLALLVPSQWSPPELQKPLLLERFCLGIRIYDFEVYLSGYPGFYFYPSWALARVFFGFRPHIVHVHQEVFSLSALQLAIWSRFMRKIFVVECAENTDFPLSIFRRIARKFVLATANSIVHCSHGGPEALRRWGYSGPVQVIPHLGVNHKVFYPRPLPRKDTAFTIGFVGRFVYQKGIDLIFSAARLLCDRGHQFRIVICGAGPEESNLRRMSVLLKVSDLITWKATVRQDQVPEIMSDFDVLILPSRTIPTWKEQFGHVLIEAMAMGIPVIGSSCGEIPYVIGRKDLIFPEGDAHQLAAIIERLLTDPRWRESSARYGVERVYERYTNERIAEKISGVWSHMSVH